MIRTRLSLWNALVFSIVLVSLGLTIYLTTRSFLYKGVDDDLNLRTTVMAQNWKEFADLGALEPNRTVQPPIVALPTNLGNAELMLALISPKIVFKQGLKWEADKAPYDRSSFAKSLGGESVLNTVLLDGNRIRVSSVPLKDGNEIVGVGQFATDLQPVDSAVALLGKICLLLLPVGLGVTALVGFYLTTKALQPMVAMTDAASRIKGSNLSERLPVKGNDEFATLAQTFNTMLASLEDTFNRLSKSLHTQRQFVADASHELKTPLTAIKGRVGVALRIPHAAEKYREHFQAVGRSANAMNAVVQNLIIIARSDESALELKSERIDIHELVEITMGMLPVEDVRSVHILNHVNPQLEVRGDPELLSRALMNVLENALRHSASNSNVEVSAIKRGSFVELHIKDHGIGIDPVHIPYIFDRFYRTDSARDRSSGGTGLGLSIVKSIAEAHGGSVSLSSSLNVGTQVTIALPSDQDRNPNTTTTAT